jgi:hypothetical protein
MRVSTSDETLNVAGDSVVLGCVFDGQRVAHVALALYAVVVIGAHVAVATSRGLCARASGRAS